MLFVYLSTLYSKGQTGTFYYTTLRYMNITVSSVQGARPSMEDTYIIHTFSSSGTTLLAVFDGHGGRFVSEYAASRFLDFLKWSSQEDQDVGSAAKAIEDALLAMDNSLRPTRTVSGSTANIVVITATHILCANVGDSRACLLTGDTCVPLSTDHKPDLAQERTRIESAGGIVLYSLGAVARVDGVLALSRALGDFEFKRGVNPSIQKIIAVPEITVRRRREAADQFIIVASDGLWDVMSNEDALNQLRERPHAAHLVQNAISRYSNDNITAIVLSF